MNLNRGELQKTIGFVFGIAVLLIFAVIAEGPLTTASTDAVTQTFTNVSPSGAAGQIVTLNRQNWYTDTSRMTVSGSTDGSLATSTMAADRLTLTINGGSTTQTVSVVHRSARDTASDSSDTDNILVLLLSIFPFFMIIGGVASSFIQVGRASGVGRGGQSLGIGAMGNGIVILAGVIMTPIVITFIDNVDSTYTVAPEYTGVTTVTPLVIVSYLLGLVSTLFSGIAVKGVAAVRRRSSGRRFR